MKRGLVLEGGGARGAYHIGSYKALFERNIEFDGITGTSIGALNGAMIVQGEFEKCYKMWENISADQIVDLSDTNISELSKLNFNVDSIFSLRHRLKDVISNKGFDIGPLKKMIDENIDEDIIRRSNIDFGLVTVNLSDMKSLELFKEDIPEGQIKDFVLASAYLPAFKAEKLHDKYYLDGAFSDNLPFSMLLKKGYDELVIIRTHATGITKKINEHEINALVIEPSQDLGKTFDFTKSLAERNLKMGYYDTIRKLDKYKGKIYTINSNISEDEYFNYLSNLCDEKVDKIRKVSHTQDIPRKRAIFEIVIPKIADYLKLEKTYNYSDCLIALLEKRAKDLEVDEFRIYDIEEFYVLVKNKSQDVLPIEDEKTKDELGTIEYIIERIELDTVFNMDKIINQIIDIILSNDDILYLE